MKILIAEDDTTSRRILRTILERADHEVIECVDGTEALAALTAPGKLRLAVLDWMMPGIDGPTVVRNVRAANLEREPYLILLTAKAQREDIIVGLEAGADDYVTKPFSRDELLARIRAGARIVELQDRLQARVADLERALGEIRTLRGLIPMCAHCKRVRDDEGFWEEVESYVLKYTDASVSHGLCPDCVRELYPEYGEIKQKQNAFRGEGSSSGDATGSPERA